MISTTAEVLSIRSPATPRGAVVAANWFARLSNWLTRPSAVRPTSRNQQAASVRELAYRVQYTDPGFAADLFAAASRHESLDD